MRVGLTGGIASGKSTVLTEFKALGASVIDADLVAREVVQPGSKGLKRVVDRFGSEYIHDDGTLNRAKLGELIFADDMKRKALNELLHPLINANIRQQMAHFETNVPQVPVIVDIPLLIENCLMDLFGKIVVVYVPERLQIERLMVRNELTEHEARQRVQTQMPLGEKKQYADYVIDNSGDVHNTRRQVEHIWGCLCREMGQVGNS